MMKISVIAAMDEKRGIGKNNKIPWHIKEDLVRLKSLTLGKIVILGRKSYESMDFYYNRTGRPMPGKLYVVVTRDEDYKPVRENVQVAHSLDEAVSFARPSVIPNLIGNLDSRFRGNDKENVEVFVIGGGQIFHQALPIADKLYLTIVNGHYNCDAFFPDYSDFKKVISEESKESEGHKYKFLELER